MLLGPCTVAQSGALDHAEILGRLAQGYWPSYIAHLVKRQGVSFGSSADFIERVKLAGGDGILAERLYTSDPSEQTHSISNKELSYEHLAKCAELIHEGGIEQAEPECRASIDENPKSAWPLIATAKVLQLEYSRRAAHETDKKRQDERIELLRRATVLAPYVAAIHRDLAPGLPPREAMGEMQKASLLDTEKLELSESGELGFQVSQFAFGNADDDAELAASSHEPITIDPELQRRMQIEPDLVSNHLILSIRYMQVKNFEKAESELQEAIRLEPDNPVLHNTLAGYYLYRRNQEACLAELREGVRIVPLGIMPHMTVAGALEVFGRTSEAIAEFQSLIATHPAAVEPSDALVELYLTHKDLNSAIWELRRSLGASSVTVTNEGELVEARFGDEQRLANLLKEDRQLAAAAEQYIYLLRFKPDDAGLHNDYGNVLLDEKKLDDAISEYNESLRLEPEMSAAHNNIGLCLAMKKDLDGAITEFRQALELNPDEPHTQIYLGAALGQKGDLTGAREQFQEAIAKNPNDPVAHVQLAYALMQVKEESGAIDELKLALKLQPDSAEAENNLAWVYATAEDGKLRNPAESLAFARRAVKDSPQPNAAFLDTLAEALLLNGQAGEAFTIEKQALELDPQNPEMQSRLTHFRQATLESTEQAASRKP